MVGGDAHLPILEGEHESEAYAVLLDARSVVVHAADVVDGEQLEDVVYTDSYLPIRLVVSELARILRELEEHCVVLVAVE